MPVLDRMYAIALAGSDTIAPTVHLPMVTGTALSEGELVGFTSGYIAVLAAGKNVSASTSIPVGILEQKQASGNASGTLVPVTLCLPYKFWIGSFAKGSATAVTDFPDGGTPANAYVTSNIASGNATGAAQISSTTAAGGLVKMLCPASNFGKFGIRGNIIEKAGTTYGAAQALTPDSDMGVIGDNTIRVIFTCNANATMFGE